jgi:hypothetical protein
VTAKVLLSSFGKAPLKDVPLAARLVWAHIFLHGAGRYSSRQLGAALGITHVTAERSLTLLIEIGLVLVLEQAAGSVAALFEAKAV